MNFALPCVVCKKQLENVQAPGEGNQPYSGNEFVTYGAYGSAVFDPMDGCSLAMNICDDCTKTAIKEGHTREYPPAKPGSERQHLLDRIEELETMLGSEVLS